MPRLFSVILCLIYVLCVPTTLAAPINGTSNLTEPQDGTPVTVITVTTIQSSPGPTVETCTVTLTPIKVNGQDAFREEKSCTQAPASNNNNPSPVSSGGSSDDSPSSTQQSISITASSATTQQATSVTASSAASINTANPNGQSSTLSLSQSLVVPTDVQVIGASSTSADTPSALVSVSATASISTIAAAPTDSTVLDPSSMPAASTSTAANTALSSSSTTVAPSTSGTTAAFAIPGKQIQVLPIGLGVFAGVSVIALIVVGLVTYERTKYRRKFRKDKLAESAAPMGMIERR